MQYSLKNDDSRIPAKWSRQSKKKGQHTKFMGLKQEKWHSSRKLRGFPYSVPCLTNLTKLKKRKRM